MPATGENRRRIAREYGRRNRSKMTAYHQAVQGSGLTYHQEYIRHRLEVFLRNNAKKRARDKGLPFTITIEDVRRLLGDMRCPVPGCGKMMHVGDRQQSKDSPTLDQVRVGRGYVLGNVAVICQNCNRRKADSSPDDLRTLAAWIETYDAHDIDPKAGGPAVQAQLDKLHKQSAATPNPSDIVARC